MVKKKKIKLKKYSRNKIFGNQIRFKIMKIICNELVKRIFQ